MQEYVSDVNLISEMGAMEYDLFENYKDAEIALKTQVIFKKYGVNSYFDLYYKSKHSFVELYNYAVNKIKTNKLLDISR